MPPLALTMGEPGGVAPEITLKAWAALRETGPAFFTLADPEILQRADFPIVPIDEAQQGLEAFSRGLPVMALKNPANATTGIADPASAPAILESIERAVAMTLAGACGAVVTNPIQKSSLMAAGFSFPGHTEFLAELTDTHTGGGSGENMVAEDDPRGAVMMLAGPDLKTVPVTIHLSVRDAVASLTGALIVRTAIITHNALRRDFGIGRPRLAISGLNPHAGEGGALGGEDELIIAPAIDELRARGINARGPLPADTMFHEDARARYDAALCMLHDQALIPAKALAFHEAVNVTLGLPIVRTSPDHGSALDIAGKDSARADSLIAALRLADKMRRVRAGAQ